MRWFLALLVLLLAAWYFLPARDPLPVEETFIAEPVKRLEDAEAYEDRYLEEADARKQRLEEALDGDG